MTRTPALRIAALVGAAALLTGCGAASPIQTQELYAPSDGVRLELGGGIRVENIFLLTEDAGSPTRPIGALVNDSATDAEVTLIVGSDSQTFTIGPEGVVNLEDAAGVIEGADTVPGSTFAVQFVAGGSTIYDVPVLDGTLEPYDQLLP